MSFLSCIGSGSEAEHGDPLPAGEYELYAMVQNLGLEKLRSAVDTGIPIDAYGLRDDETTLLFEVSANADAPEPYWQPAELDRVVAIVVVSGVPYGGESWFSELCG